MKLITIALIFLSFSQRGNCLQVGAGKSDITVLSPGNVMFGYADPLNNHTTGIHSKLYARSFAFRDNHGNYVAFISADLGHISIRLKEEVLKKIRTYLPMYNETNVLLSATHTHSAPSGYSDYMLYDLAGRYTKDIFKNELLTNFSPIILEQISEKIFMSLYFAHQNLQESYLYYKTSNLYGITANRSEIAFLGNPDHHNFPNQVDTRFKQLLIYNKNQLSGAINWFSIHATSMSKFNTLLSSDNLGYASEESQKKLYNHPLISFSSTAAGDVSPLHTFTDPEFKTPNHIKVEKVGAKLAKHFLINMNVNPHQKINDSLNIQGHLRWVYMPGFKTSKNKTLCPPAIGMSFAAGAEDGPSQVPTFFEGMNSLTYQPHPLIEGLITKLTQNILYLKEANQVDKICHFPKAIFMMTKGGYATPERLPFQILKIGSLLILGVPSEMTTVAGYRLESEVYKIAQADGIKDIVIAGLSNAYSGYVTTPEEYDFQHYEGASTHFGKYTLDAYIDIFLDLYKTTK